MKVWITAYALTKGIIEVEGEAYGDGTFFRSAKYESSFYKPDWHETRESAIARAREMQAKKIASLQKQIKKIEGLKFED